MNNDKVHDIQINPLCRLIWNTAEAKNYWEPRIYKCQQIIDKIRFEAYKTGLLKTYGFWMSVNDYDEGKLELASQYGECISSIPSGTPHVRRFKYYNLYDTDTGYYYLFSNTDDFNEFHYNLVRIYDLSLTLGYTNATLETCNWYDNLAQQHIYDPIGEMEDSNHMSFLINPFLRHLGLSILPYIPKSWTDEYSMDLASKLWSMIETRDEVIARDLKALLELPTRWDCWRGLAIIDTPIFKSVTDSVPYVQKVVVDYEPENPVYARSLIPGAARGTIFPYIPKSAEDVSKRMKQYKLKKGYGI